MFGNNNITEDARFPKKYCKGFNVGISLVKQLSTDRQEVVKEILHAMILEQPKDVSYHAMLTGFCYEIENVKSKELSKSRMAEIDRINEKPKSRDNEHCR